MAALPDPVVDPAAYTEDYCRQWCAGSEEWVGYDGRAVAGSYPGFLAKAGLRDGDVVVDIGTGRGELLAVAVQRGARRAHGIEYPLRRAFVDVGFETEVSLGRWIHTEHAAAKRLYGRLAKLGPLAHLGVADLWARGTVAA